ncbi:hypothetical protein HELRODRAFT_159320 [Helobdella robusta]|uniref:FERM domain-containing protein n=1 Tax=Helobdella robusta TaxID=6412 RepID=T1ENW0_HELRO|nr:hypothetical protein HELRODRAFT_159320 [Helobdella robusta]ESO12737.1 hypothetical protein HELRODRAFT_159320 [Helobdella robusta]
MAIYSHHPLHHHRKSNEFSSGRKTGDDVDGDVGSDNNDDSLMIILWPSLPASTLQRPSSGLSPVYLNIHKSSNDVQWYHSLLKTAALRRNSSSNITSSVSNIQLTPSKFSATSVRQHSDFEKLVHNLLLSTDGHLSSFASAASTSASSSSPATTTRSTTTTTAHALWKDPLLLPSKQPLTHSILTMHNPELEKVARDIFDTILKFMLLPLDSIDMDKKVGLVQSIFELCIRNHQCLKDELYCQLIKQTAHVVSHIQSQQQHHKTLGTLLCGGHHWFLCDSSPTSPLNSTIESSDLKLTSPNSQSESSIQAWQLLAMAIPLFLPARCSIRWLLRTYLQRSSDSKSESGKFASFCERAVERTMKNGPRCHPPSHLEVISVLSHNPYHHSQPISIPIHLPNNSYQVVSFDGSTTILELLKTLNEQLNMRSHTQSGYALFACNSNAQEQLICCHDYKTKICDVLSFLEAKFNMNSKSKHDRNPVKLIYKNRLPYVTLSEHDCFRLYMRHNLQHETSKEMLLCCYQLNEQICSAFMPISWSLAVELAALMAQIEFGDIKISSDVKPAKTSSTSSSSSSSSHLIILAQVIERFFPQHLLSEYSADVKKNRDSMESRLVDSWFKLRGKASSDCVRVYLTVLRRWEFTGAAMMHVKSIRSEGGGVEDVILGVHCDGVCVLHCKTLSIVITFVLPCDLIFIFLQTPFLHRQQKPSSRDYQLDG